MTATVNWLPCEIGVVGKNEPDLEMEANKRTLRSKFGLMNENSERQVKNMPQLGSGDDDQSRNLGTVAMK